MSTSGKTIVFVATVVGLLFSSFVIAKHFWRGTTLSMSEVAKKWGEGQFSKEKFKKASESERARMAYSLLKNQKLFIGKDITEIRQELGDPNGYYFTDIYPAYIIETAETDDQDSWQIVFLLNRKLKVSKIIVHKNCCDR